MSYANPLRDPQDRRLPRIAGPCGMVLFGVTGDPEADLAVPDRPFTFQEFLLAQAVGDGQVLAEHGRPVLRLHVSSPGDLGAVRSVLSGRGA